MFKVRLIIEELQVETTDGEGDVVASLEKDVELPFAPFPGLVIEEPNEQYPQHEETGCGLDLLTVDTVYWVRPEKRFDVEVSPSFDSVGGETKADALASFLASGWRER
jgi:hypothetical protein